MRRASLTLLLLALVGCGSTPSQPAAPAPTTQPSATTVATLTPTARSSPLAQANTLGGCGVIEMVGPTITNDAAARSAEECFWQAYQRCAVGDNSFLVVQRVDPSAFRGWTYRLVASGSNCTIQVDSSIVPGGPQSTAGGGISRALCTSLTRDARGTLALIDCAGLVEQIPPLQ